MEIVFDILINLSTFEMIAIGLAFFIVVNVLIKLLGGFVGWETEADFPLFELMENLCGADGSGDCGGDGGGGGD